MANETSFATGDDILEPTYNLAEKHRAELGREYLVDPVHMLMKQNKAIVDELGGQGVADGETHKIVAGRIWYHNA